MFTFRSNKSAWFKCQDCDYEWFTKICKVTRERKHLCGACGGVSVKVNQKLFEKRIAELGNNEYAVVGLYETNDIKVDLFHHRCRGIWAVKPRKFYAGHRCRNCCHEDMVKSNEHFSNDLKNKRGDDYILVGDYERDRLPVKIKHIPCGEIYNAIPNMILQGKNSCPSCFPVVRYSNDYFLEHLPETHKERFEYLNLSINNQDSTIEFYCKKHKSIYNQKAWLHLQSVYCCPECEAEAISERMSKTHEEYEQQVFDVYGDEFKVIGKYTSGKESIVVYHSLCEQTFPIHAQAFLNGRGCKKCKETEGERKVRNFLTKHGFTFVQQKTFAGLVGIGGGRLAFDFFVTHYKEDIIKPGFCIGFHGIQHYQPIPFFGGEEQFLKQQEHDRRKREFCKEHGYAHLEIKYDKDVQTEILVKMQELELVERIDFESRIQPIGKQLSMFGEAA